MKRVGGWELLRCIGQGQIAAVYQARLADSPADQPPGYAIKMLVGAWADDPRGVELFRQEARLGRQVSHPHLVPILAANFGEPPYLVMPYLPGCTLAELLARGDRPVLPRALWIARQVAEALAALDAAGWMHADVKPSNIFISGQGHVTLIDLGFAQRTNELAALETRPILGTLNYIAPEMLTSNLRIDIRSDIYSLGVTLFETLAGRLPFLGTTMEELVRQHRQGLPGDLRALVPHLPARVARLVRQMLAKDPIRRPQTAEELIERLTELEIETFAEWVPAA